MADFEKKERIPFAKRLSTKYGFLVLVTTFLLFFIMIVFISSVITKQIENISYNFAEGITDGRAGEIENWINIYKSDLRVYSDAEINKMGDDNEVITWLQ